MFDRILKYILILSNDTLSILEIIIRLDCDLIKYEIIDKSDGWVIIESEDPNIENAFTKLGGIFKVSKSNIEAIKDLDELNPESLLSELLGNQLNNRKLIWGLSIYSNKEHDLNEINETITKSFKQTLSALGADRNKLIRSAFARFEGVSALEIPSREVTNRLLPPSGAELIVINSENRIHIAQTFRCIDHLDFRNKDFLRPHQNSEVSMPPRLARILVNLSGITKSEVLLDPFCGAGTILLEAIDLRYNIIGIDIKPEQISKANSNIKWFSKYRKITLSKSEPKIFVGDSRKLESYFKEGSIDRIVTEPILLPLLKKLPSNENASKMLKKSASTYFDSLRSMVKVLKPKGRIIMVAPEIKTLDGQLMRFPLESRITQLGLKEYKPNLAQNIQYPIIVGTEIKRALRNIYIFEKN